MFPRHHMAAVEVADRAGDEKELSGPDGALEKRLARPSAFDHPGVVTQDGPKNPEAFAGRQNAGRDHPADQRYVSPDPHLGDGRDTRGIAVADGDVGEQIFDGAKPQTPQGFATPRLDALALLQRRVDPERPPQTQGSDL